MPDCPQHDDYLAWWLDSYQRQLDRQIRDVVMRNPGAVLDLAQRIHCTADVEAAAELLADVQSRGQGLEQHRLGELARIAYVTTLIWMVRYAQRDDCPESIKALVEQCLDRPPDR